MNFHHYEEAVLQWAHDRKIIPNSNANAQLLKAVSEMGELADAENKGDRAAIVDAVGDTLVCLINYCSFHGLNVTECLASAYEQIKDRKGTLLPSGVFVKEDPVVPEEDENTFMFEGKVFTAIDDPMEDCTGCYFHTHDGCTTVPECAASQRNDRRSVVFVLKEDQ